MDQPVPAKGKTSWVLAVRRESKNRWERRAPVTPAHVKQLVQRGVKVIVQPSSLRTFPDRQYAEVRVGVCCFDILTSKNKVWRDYSR